MSKNKIRKRRDANMLNILFHPLFKVLEKVAKLRNFPSQLRSALLTLIIVTVIVVVMYSATITGVVMLWYVSH